VRSGGGPCCKEYGTFPGDFSSKSWIFSSSKECGDEELPESRVEDYS